VHTAAKVRQLCGIVNVLLCVVHYCGIVVHCFAQRKWRSDVSNFSNI
jgi:hypothetical protein